MKKCAQCGRKKRLTAFNKKGERHQPYCRRCQSDRFKARYRANHARERVRLRRNSKRQAAKIGEAILAAKQKPCTDCKVQYLPYVMDFDHVRGKKLCEIGLVKSRGWSLSKVHAEIAKCELVCANCHRERTHGKHSPLV